VSDAVEKTSIEGGMMKAAAFRCYPAFLVGILLFTLVAAPTVSRGNPGTDGAGAEKPPDSERIGDWHFAHTRNPSGGADVISIMHTADTSRSDLDLAGLIIRCDARGAEALIVLIKAFPVRARPHVTIGKLGSEKRFEATVAPPGTALLLPIDATSLVKGPWRSLDELFIQIDDDRSEIRGIVPLSGLERAFEMLLPNCIAQ
jgi:hypothetical protein